MKQKKSKLNLGTTFLIATIGTILPLIRNLFEANGNLSAVDYQYYYLFAIACISFFLSFQVANNLKITKKTDAYYLSILGLHFIFIVLFILFTTIVFGLFF